MKELFSKGSLLLLSHLLVSLINILAIPLIIKVGSAEMLGSFSIYTAILSVVYGISGFGVGFKSRRTLPSVTDNKTKSDLFNTQFTFQFCSLIVLSVILFTFWVQLSSFFGIHDKHLIVNSKIFIFYLLSQLIFSQFSDYFRYTHNVFIYSLASALNPILYLTFIFILFFTKTLFNVDAFILSQSIGTFIIGIFLLFRIRKEMKIRFKFLNFEQYKGDIIIGFPLVLSFLTDFFMSSSDRFIIASFVSIKHVGYYLPAYSLGMLIILFPRFLGVLLPPIFSREYDLGNKIKVELLTKQILRFFLLVSCAYVSGAVVLAKPILEIYANQDISVSSWYNVPIVAFGAVFYGLILIYSNLFLLEMRTKDLFHATIFSALINFSLNIFLLYHFKSILVPAITTLISYLFSFIFVRNKLKENWNLNLSFLFLCKLFLVTMTVGVFTKIVFTILGCLSLDSLVVIIISVFIGVVTFIMMLFILNLLSLKTLQKIVALFRNVSQS